MARNNSGVAVHQDGIQKPELDDGRRDLRDLVVGVRARVFRVRHQTVRLPQFDISRHRRGEGGGHEKKAGGGPGS